MVTKAQSHQLAWWLGLVAIVGLVAGGLAASWYYYAYRASILPGVRVGALPLTGLTRDQAEAKLQSAWDKVAAAGIPVLAGEHSLTLTPVGSSATDPDLTYELVHFDAARNAGLAFTLGHSGSWWQQWITPFIALVRKPDLKPQFEVHQEQIATYLRQNLPGLEQTPRPARITIDEVGNIQVLPEVPGTAIDVADFTNQLTTALVPLRVPVGPLEVNLSTVNPSLTQARVLEGLPAVRELLRENDLTFTFERETWRVPPARWHQWLEVRALGTGVEAGLSPTLAKDFFTEIESSVNQAAQEAKVELSDGRVVAFQPSQQGRLVEVAATLQAAEALLGAGSSQPLPLTVQTTEPTVSTADANNLGIADIIGVGTSSFAGSPKNRRSNIRTGAAKLNGVIIKPDEEFSLIKALGTIDETTGYLQELVIKGDKTIPEFGGGLCQIGTTTFRAALASGLPILERRNHSYRVAYYEPAGTDATIYSPKPDFRFKNDTGQAILIQTKIKGDTLSFEFWGTKDGRSVVQTKPAISNFVPPPPPKVVETEDLPVGTKKCTEKAHVGADTKFTYTVTYADGRQAENVFKSHYIPWQEVCLVGVPKGTLTPPATTSGDGSMLLPSADTAGVRGN